MMFRSTIGRCILFVALGIGVCASQASGAASIVRLSETGTSLSLRFTDAVGAQTTMNFSRPGTTDQWNGGSAPGAELGIIFGRTDPIYATPARQRALGITPDQAMTTLRSSIIQRPLADVTIFQLDSGEMAIALWQSNMITEIWYVGTLVEEVMFAPGFQGWQFCARALSLCCATVPNPFPELGEPTTIPHPRISSCKIVAKNCGEAAKQSACNCLNTACNFCFNHGQYCCGPAETPPDPNCQTPWLPEESEAACDAGVEVCVTPPAPPVPPVVPAAADALLDEIANRLTVRVDIQNAA